MSVNSLHGILAALVTPFDEAGLLNSHALERLIERVYSAGADGIYLCGSTGEGLLQSIEQRKRVTEVALRNSPPGKQVIVHTGANSTADAAELSRHAAKAGATAISSLPPYGNYSFAELRRYYQYLAEQSEVPLLVYFFPAATTAISTVEQILELCALPNVAGLKYTDYNLYRLSILAQSGPVVFNGYDEVLVAGLLMGASGGIGTFYNVVPELFVQVSQLATKGCWAEARAVQERINELIELTLQYPCFPAVKTMLRWSGIDCGQCMEPRRALTTEEETQLRADLRASSFAYLAG